MRKVLMLSMLVPALFIGLSAAAAPVASGTGSVKGKVVGADGKPVANAPVRLMHREAKAEAKTAAPAGNATEPHKGHKAQGATAVPSKGEKASAKAEKAAETTTDANGMFAFDHVAAGKYVAVSRIKGVGAGREQVTVNDAQASVTIKLKAPGEKGKGKQPQARANRHHKAAVS
jgi:uncharacterized GH25 family protein